MNERISIILSTQLLKEIESLQNILNMDKSTVIRYLLNKSIKDAKIDIALDAYKQGKVSFGKASEIAGITLWEFIDICRSRKVSLNFNPEDADFGIKRVKEFNLEKYKASIKKNN